MSRFIKIGEAAKILGVSVQILRRWEVSKVLVPSKKVQSTRYYNLDSLLGSKNVENNLTVAYARVSSHDQKMVLEAIRIKSL